MSKELISALGGVKAVAEHLNTSSGAVANWQLEGRTIPWRWRYALARLAEEHCVEVPKDFLTPTSEARA